jgi:hypothetical protein
MAFGQATYGGITAHCGDVIKVDGKEQGRVAHPGCRQCGLATCMTSTHYNYVIFFIKCGHGRETSK